jgi:hypothetical protein
MRKRLKLLSALCILGLLVSGCSNTASDSAGTANPELTAESSSQDQASDWTCESSQDGLGESLLCRTRYVDDEEIYWTLVLMCTSDLRALHSVSGIRYPSGASVMWPEENTAKIRLDSNALEEINILSKAGGEGFVFTESRKFNENSDTWYLLSKIASAKTLGFKANDTGGQPQSALFKVAGSVPIAARFSVLGCSSS